MKLSEYIDQKLEKGVHDIIFKDEHGNEIEINCESINLNDVVSIDYHKIAIIIVKSQNKL